MSVVGEFTVPAASLAMESALSAAPEVAVEIERVVAHPGGTLAPYFWVRGGDPAAFDAALRDDPSVEAATRLDSFEDGVLYRAEWTPDVVSVGQAYLETGATVLEATGRGESWTLRLRFDAHEDVSAFYAYCEEHGVDYQVDRIYSPSTPPRGEADGLTPKQREALAAALDAGFYEVPPRATMEAVASEIGISQQALSKRLRRAHGALAREVAGDRRVTVRDGGGGGDDGSGSE